MLLVGDFVEESSSYHKSNLDHIHPVTAQSRLKSYAHLHLLYDRIRLDHLTFSFTEVENESLDNCSAKLMRNHDKNDLEE